MKTAQEWRAYFAEGHGRGPRMDDVLEALADMQEVERRFAGMCAALDATQEQLAASRGTWKELEEAVHRLESEKGKVGRELAQLKDWQDEAKNFIRGCRCR